MPIEQIIKPREKDLGGFIVRRLLPYAKRRMVGPWIFFDHLGPVNFPAGKGIDVRPHPHINLATVTYLFEGEILHRDSVGSEQLIRPGDINLMVAGKGIVHSERTRAEIKAQPHNLHALQLWHALPVADEEIEPAFYHYPSADIPIHNDDNLSVRVMIGSGWGVSSPVKTFANTFYAEAEMQLGSILQLTEIEQLAIYVISGEVIIEGNNISQNDMVVLEDNYVGDVTAASDSRIAIIGGKKLGERFIEWNFVSSRPERIEQAKDDWQARRFPLVPNDEDEFIPLPE